MSWWWRSFGPATGTSADDPAASTKGPTACPVDSETREKYVLHQQQQAKCPVDHHAREAYLQMAKEHAPPPQRGTQQKNLSEEREVSSIPRFYMDQDSDASLESAHAPAESSSVSGAREHHWVYPSPQQFYSAIRRKNHAASPEDMDIVVPIHNAVNEEAWRRILEWERAWQTDPKATGPQLVNFVGRPKDMTWRAWFRGLAGYEMPFDRHDWVIVRPRTDNGAPQTMRYIIDFYAGRSTVTTSSSKTSHQQPVSFYLDVRPAPSSVEGIAMRMHRWWQDLKV